MKGRYERITDINIGPLYVDVYMDQYKEREKTIVDCENIKIMILYLRPAYGFCGNVRNIDFWIIQSAVIWPYVSFYSWDKPLKIKSIIF